MKAMTLPPPPRKEEAKEKCEPLPPSPRLGQEMEQLSLKQLAAYAIDGAQRIIAWNRQAETLLGVPARAVLGRHCYEVLAGRDGNGNLYCRRDCPVARQARADLDVDDPVHPFPMLVKDAAGKLRRLVASLFAVRTGGPGAASVVHVCRDESAEKAAAAPAPAEQPAEFPLLPDGVPAAAAVHLSKREWQVLNQLAMGLPSNAIAKQLFISPVTVRNHIQTILNELGVHSKLQAVVYAYQHNLVDRSLPEIWPGQASLRRKPCLDEHAAASAPHPAVTASGRRAHSPSQRALATTH